MSRKREMKNILAGGMALLIVAVTTACSDADQSPPAAGTLAGLQQALPEVTVYKSPTCGCCKEWVDHLERAGFKVITHDSNNMDQLKKSLGLQSHLASCHTATIGDYVIEGHVPAADIKRLLREKPKVVGLAAPGMPRHSPGMQPPGEQPRGYEVLAFDEAGKTQVFTKY